MANSAKMSKLQQLYQCIFTSGSPHMLPSSWQSKDHQPAYKFSSSGLSVTRVSDASPQRTSNRRSGSDQNNPVDSATAYPIIKSDYLIPYNIGIYYYETEICTIKPDCLIVIGFSTKNALKSTVWDSSCYGLDNNGALYNVTSDKNICPDGFKEKDVIGCGVNFINNSFFFTKNGQFLGNAFEGVIGEYENSEVRPVILLDGLQTKISTNFGEKAFVYPFMKFLSKERFIQENQLINALSNEFVDVKMRDLVTGYLVHHGYIETANSFSRWTKMGESASSPKKTRSDADMPSATLAEGELAETVDSSKECDPESGESESFPGISSMKHRRSLRSFCQRCKFGLVASTLFALYPKIVEKYPELILQLRCRQLIEMVHRHSVRHLGQGPISASSDSKLLIHQRQQKEQQLEEEICGRSRSSRKRPCVVDTTSSDAPFCACTSGSVPTLATYDDSRAQPLTQQSHGLGSSAATSCDAMDIDSSSLAPESTSEQASINIPQIQSPLLQQQVNKSHQAACDSEALISQALAVRDFPDEDDDETNDPNPLVPMDTGSLSDTAPQLQQVPSATGSSASLNVLSGGDSDYLMRQIRFSRSLMDMAKDLEKKKIELSTITKNLLHDSVCLLAYEKPADPDCPLRCLLDSSGRDNIASLINSAILTEEHKLPAQPTIEKVLYELERHLTSGVVNQAQSLAHFLFYHLTPSQYHEQMNHFAKSKVEPQTPSDPPSSNNGTNGNNSNSKADESFQSIEHPRGTVRRNRRLNYGPFFNGNSNGRTSPPKRRSNGARRRYWRRQVLVDSTEDDDEIEEEVGDFSPEDEGEGVQLHRHEELEEDIEMNIEGGDRDGESLDDDEEEAEVELMTASMEEDGFEDSQEEIAYDELEGILQGEEAEDEDVIQFAEWNNEGWNRPPSSQNQEEADGGSRGSRAPTNRQRSEGAGTEPLLSYISRSPRYGRTTAIEGSSATENFWTRVSLYSSRNLRRGQHPPPSSSTSGDDATNNVNQ